MMSLQPHILISHLYWLLHAAKLSDSFIRATWFVNRSTTCCAFCDLCIQLRLEWLYLKQ